MDGFSSSKFLEAVAPAVQASTLATGTAIDARGFLYAHFSVHAGAVVSLGTVPVQIESSATTGGTYADIVGAVVTASAAGLQTIAVRLDATTQLGWIRVKTGAVGGTSIALGVTCMLTNAANSANYASTPTVTV